MSLCVLALIACETFLAYICPVTSVAGYLHEYGGSDACADDIADLLFVAVLPAGYKFLIECVVHYIFL